MLCRPGPFCSRVNRSLASVAGLLNAPTALVPHLLLAAIAINCGGTSPPVSSKQKVDQQKAPQAQKPTFGFGGSFKRIATEAVIPGRLTVAVAHGKIRPDGTMGWMYKSGGFDSLGRKELILIVTRTAGRPPSSFPRDVFRLYRELFRAVEQGAKLLPWELAILPFGVAGREDFKGVFIAPGVGGTPAVGVNSMILMTERETELARTAGAARIAGNLGRHYRYFPIPYWVDPTRKSVVPKGATTMLARMHRVFLVDINAILYSSGKPKPIGMDARSKLPNASNIVLGTLVLRMTRAAGRDLAKRYKQLSPNQVIAVQLAPDPTAEARLVWDHARKQLTAITHSPTGLARSFAGTFIVVAPLDNGTPLGASPLEDGFGIIVTTAQYKKLLEALERGTAFRVQGKDKMSSVVLQWTD